MEPFFCDGDKEEGDITLFTNNVIVCFDDISSKYEVRRKDKEGVSYLAVRSAYHVLSTERQTGQLPPPR